MLLNDTLKFSSLLASISMKELPVYSPYDRRFLKTVSLDSLKCAQIKLAHADELFHDKQQRLSPAHRIAILNKFCSLLEQKKEDLAKLATSEGGKPIMDSRIEVERAIQGVKVAAEWVSRMTGVEIPMQLTPSSMHRKAYTLREPVGVVLAISAFNHPINLIIHQVIPALAVGCPVLIKPALETPLSCLALTELLYAAGLPKHWCQPLICTNETAEQLVQDPRVSFLTFIGSTEVGWHLRSLLPKGARCALEHGGTAPVIITQTADLEDALPLLVKGGFYHAGQVCVSVQRVFVINEKAEAVAQQLALYASQLRVGDPLDEKTEIGPLIREKEIERISRWVDSALQQGARLLCGGNRLTNNSYSPTVLYQPPLEHPISQQEIFGPVVCIYPYQSLEEAVDLANQLPFAFQSAIFTQIIDEAWYAVQHLNANTVLINDHTAFRVDWMPFGGRKHSGLGTGGIPYSMLDMTYEKLMVWRSSSL